jgi:hypothetical protein
MYFNSVFQLFAMMFLSVDRLAFEVKVHTFLHDGDSSLISPDRFARRVLLCTVEFCFRFAIALF